MRLNKLMFGVLGIGLVYLGAMRGGNNIDIEGQSRCTMRSGTNGGSFVCEGDVNFSLEAQATDINVNDPAAGPTALDLRIKVHGYGLGANVRVGYDLKDGVFSPRWDLETEGFGG